MHHSENHFLLHISRGMKSSHHERWRRDDCGRKIGLASAKQVKICKSNIGLMKFVEDSARLAKDECREQFHSRTWDCSSLTKAPNFGFDLKSGLDSSNLIKLLSICSLCF